MKTDDPLPALGIDALVLASAVLDVSVGGKPLAAGGFDGQGLHTVALLHMIRAEAMRAHPDQHREHGAYGALLVLISMVAPDWLAPQAVATVDTMIMNGASVDLPNATMMAMWNHATAVRAAWRGMAAPSISDTDLLVRAFQRAADVAGPDVAGHATRMVTLAGTYDARIRLRHPGDSALPADLHHGIDAVTTGLASNPTSHDTRLRGHRLNGDLHLHRWQLSKNPADLKPPGTPSSRPQPLLDLPIRHTTSTWHGSTRCVHCCNDVGPELGLGNLPIGAEVLGLRVLRERHGHDRGGQTVRVRGRNGRYGLERVDDPCAQGNGTGFSCIVCLWMKNWAWTGLS